MGKGKGGSFDLEFVQKAARYAEKAHSTDVRKGTDIPYIAHLWSVAALVMEHGGDDHQVAAALLHDVVEDHGGKARLKKVREKFGKDVARMVKDLSDRTAGDEKPPWRERKQAYLDHLESVDKRTALVSAADKLHNLRAIVSDYREVGPALWSRFNQPDPAAHRWYYESLVEILAEKVPPPLTDELRRTVDELTALIAEKQPGSAVGWRPRSINAPR